MTSNRPASRTSLWGIALAIGLIALIHELSAILAPFVLGILLAYLCHPLVARLARPWFPGGLASALVLLLITGVLALMGVFLVPLLASDVNVVLTRLPQAFATLHDWAAPWLHDVLGLDWDGSPDRWRDLIMQNLGTTETALQRVAHSASLGGAWLAGTLLTVLLTPVVTFYLLKDWERILRRLRGAIPSAWLPEVSSLASEIDTMLGQYLRGQLMVMVIMAVYYAAGLRLAGLTAGVAIGALTGFLVFIPYLGVLTGFLLAVLSALIQAPATSGLLLPVLGVYALGHALEGTLVTPRLVGERIGLHPVAIIFALMAFGKLLGFFGVLVALPATTVLWAAVRHFARKKAAHDPA